MSGPTPLHRSFSVGAIILLAFIVACAPPALPQQPSGQAAGSPTSMTEAKETRAEGGPQRGGTFVFAVPGRFANCNTYEVADRPTNQTLDHVYETLVRYDYNRPDYRQNMAVVPWLASRWEKPDATTFVFTLRETTWHDGKPFTADDVVATFNLLKSKNYAAYSNWRAFKSVEAVNAHTVKFTLQQPTADWVVLSNLAEPSNAHILAKHVIEGGTLATACIGTGPFKIQQIEPNSRAQMVRYDGYWQKDERGQQQPYLERMEIIYGMDRSAMQGAFAAGELDLIPLTTFPEVESFTRQVPGAQVYTYYAHWSHGLVVNVGRAPFSDKRVRQAVNLLIDRQAVIDTVTFGKGIISLPVVPAVRSEWGLSAEEAARLPGYRADKRQDIAEARKLLADAGYGPGGKPLSFELLYTRTWAVAPMADFVAAQLKEHGIEVKLRGVDSATFAKERREGLYDVALWHTASPDPLLRPQQNWYTKSPDAQGAKIPDLGQDKLIDEFRVATDPERQKQLVLQLQKLVLEEVWAFALADPPFYAVVQPWVQGYRPSLSVQPEPTGSANQLWMDLDRLPAKRKS